MPRSSNKKKRLFANFESPIDSPPLERGQGGVLEPDAQDFLDTDAESEESKTNTPRLSTEQALKIASFRANNPNYTVRALAGKFKCNIYQVRYALRRYAEQAKNLKNTKLGRQIQGALLTGVTDDIQTLRTQLEYCLMELESSNNLALRSRVDLLFKIMRIRQHLQDVEIESHLKRPDAEIIASIIRRFHPEASNDDIIKIYNEEVMKLKNKHTP